MFMMLTGGIDDDDGKSTLFGRPVGADAGSPVTAAAAAAAGGRPAPATGLAGGAPPDHVGA